MAPGDKAILKVVMQTQEVTIDGDTTSEIVEVGSVVRATPGPVIPGAEFIALITDEGQFRWSAPLADYDPLTVDDEPANEARWVPA